MRVSKQVLAAAAVVGAVAAAGSAFTASNTVPTVKAGQGTTVTSGYAVSNVAYTLGTGSLGDKITQVRLTLDAAAAQVKVRLVTGGTYFDCTNTALTNDWTCALTVNVATADANVLDVVAVSQSAPLL